MKMNKLANKAFRETSFKHIGKTEKRVRRYLVRKDEVEEITKKDEADGYKLVSRKREYGLYNLRFEK
jgi:tmRNA-binding protein